MQIGKKDMMHKTKKALQKWNQNEYFQRLKPHCKIGDKGACERIFKLGIQLCEKGEVALCADIAERYRNGWDKLNLSPDLKAAQKYADKVCTMDGVYCVDMSLLFTDKDNKLALKYAEKACEMGELMGCVLAFQFLSDSNDIGKNTNKAKFYADKVCKAGISEACEK